MLTFVGEDVVAVRWRQYRMYPKQFVASTGNPAIYNIEQDPREEVNVIATSGWVLGQYLRSIAAYQKSLENYPNPKAVDLTRFGG